MNAIRNHPWRGLRPAFLWRWHLLELRRRIATLGSLERRALCAGARAERN